MDDGWIKTYRKVKTHWIYDEKPFNKFHAWHDLLLSASHERKTFMLGSTPFTTEPGQFVTSLRKLGERWGWSRHKVSDFLSLLKRDTMIEVVSDATKTLITVVNWGLYQSDENKKGHEISAGGDTKKGGHGRDTKRDAGGDTNNESGALVPQGLQQPTPEFAGHERGREADTIKNIYTDNTNVLSSSQPSADDGDVEPKKKKAPPALPQDHRAYKSAKWLDKHICETIPSKKPADERTLQRWAVDIDRINRLDGQDWDDISDALMFSQSDSFWQTTILSGKKFREKFFTLLAKARQNDS